MIGEDKVAEVRQRSSIIEVVSQHVALKRVGRNHVGLCPFHAEKTPSFTVNEERGIFHCFGCGVGGDVFGFVMRVEGVGFPEAVRSLAKRCGVAVPELRRGAMAQRERLLAVNEIAAGFFAERLRQPGAGLAARRYLERRGVGSQSWERFRLGYAPCGGGDLVGFLRQRKVDLGLAFRLGLIGRRSSDGRYYDRFRDRLIFPVSDLGGRVVGFGSRVLAEQGPGASTLPKYLNSPQTPLFRKGEHLYGLAQAREGIRKAGKAVIVEGYFDVLTAFGNGMEYVVASLGTALTAHQISTLGRFTRNIIACFDADAAGEKAAMRSLAVFLEAGLWGGATFLPAGEDPDSFIRKRGRDAFEAAVAGAPPLLEFFLARVRPASGADPSQLGAACKQVAALLAKVKDPFTYDAAVKRAAEVLGVSETLLRRSGRGGEGAGGPNFAQVLPPSEERLVELMLTAQGAIEKVASSGVLDVFEDERCRTVGEELVAAFVSSGRVDVETVLRKAPPELAARMTARLLADKGEWELGETVVDEMVMGLINNVKRRHIKRLTQTLRAQIKEAEKRGELEQVRAGLRRLERLIKEEKGLREPGAR